MKLEINFKNLLLFHIKSKSLFKIIFFSILINIIYSCSVLKSTHTKNDKYLVTGWYFIDKKGTPRKLDNSKKTIYINPIPIVTYKYIKEITVYRNNIGEFGLYIIFNKTGSKKLYSASKDISRINSYLGLIINNKLIYTPKVKGSIINGVTALNRGNISKRKLIKYKNMIEKEILNQSP